MPPTGTVMRVWTGWIRSTDREAYQDYLEQTGLGEYRRTPGNLGAFAAYAEQGDECEVRTVSFWRSFDDIRGFAGDDIARAVFYPEDDRFLVRRREDVEHFVLA